MKKQTPRWPLYITVTLVIILSGIVTSSIIDRTKKDSSTDIRARASVTYGLKLNGVIVDTNLSTQTITVDRMTLVSNTEIAYDGTWTVHVPQGYVIDQNPIGSKVQMIADPTQFDIRNHTLTAKQIKR